MLIKNTDQRYGIVAILLHWLMAVLILALLIMGIYMARIPMSAFKLKLYGWHKEIGFLILALVILRLIWRCQNIVPNLSANVPCWQKRIAHIVHWLFYAFMFFIPLTGWLVTSAAGLSASFFGLFVVPNLISPNEELRILFIKAHQWLSYGLIAVICLHTLAALKHHFINKDNVLRRML